MKHGGAIMKQHVTCVLLLMLVAVIEARSYYGPYGDRNLFTRRPRTGGERNQQSEVAPPSCGLPAIRPSVSQRVVGGRQAVPHSWPWVVSLQNNFVHKCGGSLISDQWVISAAHCYAFLHNAAVKHVVVGMHYQSRTDQFYERVGIEQFFISPSYDIAYWTIGRYRRDNPRSDVMLIKLDRPITFNEAVGTVCLPESTQVVEDNTLCYAAGWGSAEVSSSASGSEELMQIALPTISSSICNQTEWHLNDTVNMSRWYYGRIDQSMICAGYELGGQDTCQGDSGGPLVCQISEHWVIHGVTSWGEGCGQQRQPGVYARVSSVRQWIDQTMGGVTSPPSLPNPVTPGQAVGTSTGRYTCDSGSNPCSGSSPVTGRFRFSHVERSKFIICLFSRCVALSCPPRTYWNQDMQICTR